MGRGGVEGGRGLWYDAMSTGPVLVASTSERDVGARRWELSDGSLAGDQSVSIVEQPVE